LRQFQNSPGLRCELSRTLKPNGRKVVRGDAKTVEASNPEPKIMKAV
jgi:hypothetical protein